MIMQAPLPPTPRVSPLQAHLEKAHLVHAEAFELNPSRLVLHREEDIGVGVLPLAAHAAYRP